MKKVVELGSLLIIICLFLSCSKSGNTTPAPEPIPPTPVAEADIVFKVETGGQEINYATIFPIQGNSQEFTINITSTLPKDGVSIDVLVKDKITSVEAFKTNLSVNTALTKITVNNLKSGILYLAAITVKSKNKETNFLKKDFELALKN